MVSWLPGLVLGTASVDSVLSEFSRPSHLSPVVGPLYLRYNGAVYSQVMLQSSQSSFLNKFQFLQCCHISDPSKRCQASVAENSIWDFQLLLLYVTDTGHLDSTDRDVKLQLPFELFLADVSCIVRAIIHSYWPYMSRSRVSVINWTGACLKLQPEAGATYTAPH